MMERPAIILLNWREYETKVEVSSAPFSSNHHEILSCVKAVLEGRGWNATYETRSPFVKVTNYNEGPEGISISAALNEAGFNVNSWMSETSMSPWLI